MTSVRRRHRPAAPSSGRRLKRSPARQLVLLGSIALAGGVGVAALQSIQDRAAKSDRLVTVYRVHGCTCVFSWADSLRASGFAVQLVELSSLTSIRSTMHTPGDLQGCHVGRYLNYFVEGHVTPEAIVSLGSQHPVALGVTTLSSANAGHVHTTIADEEHSTVMLVEPDGHMLQWFEPHG